MITEDYVSFETAKLLKEKGFDEETRGYYPIKGDATGRLMFGSEYNHNHSQVQISAPTLQSAMKWLREEKKISIEVNIIFDLDDNNKWYYEYGFCIFQLSGTFEKLAECDYDGYKIYEDACEAAIKYCLENLIDKINSL